MSSTPKEPAKAGESAQNPPGPRLTAKKLSPEEKKRVLEEAMVQQEKNMQKILEAEKAAKKESVADPKENNTEAAPAPEMERDGLPFPLKALGYFNKEDGDAPNYKKWTFDHKWTRCYHAYCPDGRYFAEFRHLDFLHENGEDQENKSMKEKRDAVKAALESKKKATESATQASPQLMAAEGTGSEDSESDQDVIPVYWFQSSDGWYCTPNFVDFFTEDGEYVMDEKFFLGVAELSDTEVVDLLSRIVLGDLDWKVLRNAMQGSRMYDHGLVSVEEQSRWMKAHSDIMKVREDPARFKQSRDDPKGLPNMREYLNDLLLWIMAIDQRWNVPQVDTIFKTLKVEFLTLVTKGYSPNNGKPGMFTVELDMTKERFAQHEEEEKRKREEKARKSNKVTLDDTSSPEGSAAKAVRFSKGAVSEVKQVVTDTFKKND